MINYKKNHIIKVKKNYQNILKNINVIHMNIKKLSILALGLLILIFAMSAIFASEDVHQNTLNTNDTMQNTSTDVNNQTINNQTTPENTTKEKIKTSVQADEKAVKYKKSSYFKIKLQDKNKTLLKNVKLKVTVKSGNKIKVFNIKKNSKGIAQFNTKGLKVGKYSVNITSDDDNYTVTKTSKIFVGKQYSVLVRFSKIKTLKNKDKIRLRVLYDKDKGKEVTVVFKNKEKYTKILKAKFIFYKPSTRKTISMMEYSKFKNGKWENPDKDYTFRSMIWKARLYYISYKA